MRFLPNNSPPFRGERKAMLNFSLLKLARKIRKRTQGEGAERSGISQSTYSKIEKGLLAASEAQVAKIAAALHFPPDFFYQNADISPALTPFRKKASIKLRDIEAAEAEGNLYRLFLDKLLDNENLLYEPISYQQEVDDDYSAAVLAAPEDIARECRRIFGIPNGPIHNLTGVLEDNGFFIIHRELPKGIDGFMLLPSRSAKVNYIIILNKDYPGERMRFSLAHELGHIIMHTKLGVEEEANQFASELLMPEAKISPYLMRARSLYDYLPIKKIWGVSIQALLHRAKTLKIITETQYKSFNVRISQLGYRQKEPAPLPREKPDLLAELNRAYKSFGFTLSEILELLCISKENYIEYFQPPPLPKPAVLAAPAPLAGAASDESLKHLRVVS